MINTLIRLILGFAVIYFVYQEAGIWTAVVCWALFLFILALAWQSKKHDEQLKAHLEGLEGLAEMLERKNKLEKGMSDRVFNEDHFK